MTKFEELQSEHSRLLEQHSAGMDPADLLKAAQVYIERVRTEAELVPDPLDRNQLRANLRFWASYIYDQTRIYPDTTMRPAVGVPSTPTSKALPPTPPPPAKKPALPVLVRALGGILILALVCVVLGALLFLPQLRNQQSQVQATQISRPDPEGPSAVDDTQIPEPVTPDLPSEAVLEAQSWLAEQLGVPIEQVNIQDMQRAEWTDSCLGLGQPHESCAQVITPGWLATFQVDEVVYEVRTDETGAVIRTLTNTAGLQTATAAVLPTQFPLPQSTPTALDIPVAPSIPATIPVTGGGGIGSGDLLFWAVTTSNSASPDCSARNLGLSFDPDGVYAPFSIAPAQVNISQAGTGDILASVELSQEARIATIELPNPVENDILLVQVNHPQLIFETVILTFTDDCLQNQRTITYLPEIQESESINNLLGVAENRQDGNLNLRWRLLTWGPSPFYYEWVAQFILDAEGGDGNYLYWASGDISEVTEGLLPGNQLMVQQTGCEPAHVLLGVSSSGRVFQRQLVLASPLCPDWNPSLETINP